MMHKGREDKPRTPLWKWIVIITLTLAMPMFFYFYKSAMAEQAIDETAPTQTPVPNALK